MASLTIRIIKLGLALALAGCGDNMAAGEARVISGDRLEIGGRIFRLTGTDSFKPPQTCTRPDGGMWACGESSSRYLRHLVAGKTVTCTTFGRDTEGQYLAHCTLAGIDLSETMIRSGLSVAYLRFSRQYVELEAKAKQARAGAWDGAFLRPSEWRTRREAENEADP